MSIFNRRKQEIRADTELSFGDPILQALLGTTTITKSIAMQIPTVASCIDLISGILSSTPIKLYQLGDEETKEIKDDARIKLINDDTGDTLNAHDFWRSIIFDYYLGKGGYAYINKARGKVASIHYVDESRISININSDPIFKDYDISVNGTPYKPYDFIKVLRNSRDGASGTGVITENSKVLEVAYATLIFEIALVKKGGNKKGFLKSDSKLEDAAIKQLKAAWSKLYGNNEENVVILNKGIDFIESSNTSVEMQLNENKETNAREIAKIFHVSPDIITGKASNDDMQSVIKLAVIPLMKTIECALNRDFLLEKEKKSFYWAFDTKELLKGDFKNRMEGYKTAIDSKVMTPNEARYFEDLKKIKGLDIISMGLADVIFDTETGMYFTPNTKQITDPNIQINNGT